MFHKIIDRATKAHERRYGQSTYIEACYMPKSDRVKVKDHELGITTYWHVHWGQSRLVSFHKQVGERL